MGITKHISKLFSLVRPKSKEPSMLAYYLLWYNRNDNWFERLSANKQIELLFWNPDCYNTSCVQSAGSTLTENDDEHLSPKHGKINACETAGLV